MCQKQLVYNTAYNSTQKRNLISDVWWVFLPEHISCLTLIYRYLYCIRSLWSDNESWWAHWGIAFSDRLLLEHALFYQSRVFPVYCVLKIQKHYGNSCKICQAYHVTTAETIITRSESRIWAFNGIAQSHYISSKITSVGLETSDADLRSLQSDDEIR